MIQYKVELNDDINNINSFNDLFVNKNKTDLIREIKISYLLDENASIKIIDMPFDLFCEFNSSDKYVSLSHAAIIIKKISFNIDNNIISEFIIYYQILNTYMGKTLKNLSESDIKIKPKVFDNPNNSKYVNGFYIDVSL